MQETKHNSQRISDEESNSIKKGKIEGLAGIKQYFQSWFFVNLWSIGVGLWSIGKLELMADAANKQIEDGLVPFIFILYFL